MFDPVRICEVLNEERVEYVVVGGFAAVIRWSSHPTRDIDIANMPVMLNLVTDHGGMDLTFEPAGRAGGFDGWRGGATGEEVSPGLIVSVASLDDIIDSKRAANRPKDLMALPYLESLRDEIERGS